MKRDRAALVTYQPPSLGGDPIPVEEWVSCIKEGMKNKSVRALIQMIEREAAVMQARGQTMQCQADGTSALYVSRAAALSELLVKVQTIVLEQRYLDPLEAQ